VVNLGADFTCIDRSTLPQLRAAHYRRLFQKGTQPDQAIALCALAQVEYSRNFGFKRHFPIHKIFERGCEISLWRITASRKSTAVQQFRNVAVAHTL
jgi:hypothetical protein